MNNKEAQTTEFKREWREEHLKVISAFANSKGGRLIIGLDDRGNPVGLKNIKKLLEDIPNIIRNKMGITPTVETGKTGDSEIMTITINPSLNPISFNGKFYLRSGSTVQELRGRELADFLIKRSGVTWDNSIEEKPEFSSIDPSTLEDFKRFATDRIPSIVHESDMKTIFDKLNLLDEGRIKRAALLLFSRETQRFYTHAIVKIGRFLTDTDIQSTDIVKGNLFQQLENTMEILRAKYLHSQIRFEGIHRRDILEYPYEALREAIINALIHRDYSSLSEIQIRVYPDKLLIMNAGGLPPEVPVENLKINHLSIPRNRLLAGIFYYAGFIEAWGRGTTMIVEKCREQGLPEPDFKDENGVLSVIFHKDKWNEVSLKNSGLNERQVKAFLYIKKTGKITNKEYMELNKNISRITATRDLNDMASMGFVHKIEGGKRKIHYVIDDAKMMQMMQK